MINPEDCNNEAMIQSKMMSMYKSGAMNISNNLSSSNSKLEQSLRHAINRQGSKM
jgi:hypothetical protein